MPVTASIPTSYNLRPMARRTIDGYDSACSVNRQMFLGDSQNDPTNSYSIATQARGVWPINWIGAWLHPDSGGDSVLGRAWEIGNAFTGGTVGSQDPVTAAGTVVPWFPIGAGTRTPYIGVCKTAVTNATPVVAANTSLVNYKSTVNLMAQWARNSNWAKDALTCDAILYKTPLGFNGSGSEAADTITIAPRRNGSASGTALAGQNTYAASDGACAWEKYTVSMDAGANAAELQVRTCTAGAGSDARELIIGGAQFYKPSINGTIHINAFSNGSSAATDIDTMLGYSATDLSSYLAALRATEGCVFHIHLGQNMTAAESADIATVWRGKMQGIVDKLRTGVMATSGAVAPYFILVSTYQSTGGSGLSDAQCLAQQAALYAIAQTNWDVGFLNLNRLADSGANMLAAGYIPDSIHPAQQNSLSANYQGGSAYFAALEIAEMFRAYNDGNAYTGRSWRGRGVA